jgi:hypothetical protein
MPFDPTFEIDDDPISIGDLVLVPGSGSDFIKDGETGTVIAADFRFFRIALCWMARRECDDTDSPGGSGLPAQRPCRPG